MALLKDGRRHDMKNEWDRIRSKQMRALTLDELIAINWTVGETAAAGAVPLSELIEGELRRSGVSIIGASHQPPPASYVRDLVKQCLACAHARKQHLLSDYARPNLAPPSFAAELVGWVYWRLSWIHPFVDGNGRTAHLAALIVANRAYGYQLLPATSSWRALLGERAAAGATEGVPTSLLDCLPFLEHRRLELRRQLVQALRATDAAWAALSRDDKQRLMAVPRSAEAASQAPWTDVGRVLVREGWAEIGTRLAQVTTRTVERRRVYRWTTDLGGGDYSTGITDTADGQNTPTWIEEPHGPRRWRDFDELQLLPVAADRR